jgi:hypothetical protein
VASGNGGADLGRDARRAHNVRPDRRYAGAERLRQLCRSAGIAPYCGGQSPHWVTGPDIQEMSSAAAFFHWRWFSLFVRDMAPWRGRGIV